MTKPCIILIILSVFLLSCDDYENSNPLPDGKVRFEENLVDENGTSIEGLNVSIWANDLRYTEVTDENGFYSIDVNLEDFPIEGQIAFIIQGSGFMPRPGLYDTPLENRTVYSLGNNTIYSCPNCIDITNANGVSADLFHLGDDSFSGSSNSQFQKDADSASGLHFRINPSQAGNQFEVVFMGKGIQQRTCDQNRIVYGNQSIELIPSPDDGSYSLNRYVFNTSNADLISLIPSNCGDVDDWEFVGLFIQKK